MFEKIQHKFGVIVLILGLKSTIFPTTFFIRIPNIVCLFPISKLISIITKMSNLKTIDESNYSKNEINTIEHT